MELILSILNNAEVQKWLVYGIAFLVAALLTWILKKKIDAKKLEPIIAKIVAWILEKAQTDEDSSLKHNLVKAQINQLPPEAQKLLQKKLGSDPAQKVYDTITQDIPKGKKSNALAEWGKSLGTVAMSALANGLVKKIF